MKSIDDFLDILALWSALFSTFVSYTIPQIIIRSYLRLEGFPTDLYENVNWIVALICLMVLFTIVWNKERGRDKALISKTITLLIYFNLTTFCISVASMLLIRGSYLRYILQPTYGWLILISIFNVLTIIFIEERFNLLKIFEVKWKIKGDPIKKRVICATIAATIIINLILLYFTPQILPESTNRTEYVLFANNYNLAPTTYKKEEYFIQTGVFLNRRMISDFVTLSLNDLGLRYEKSEDKEKLYFKINSSDLRPLPPLIESLLDPELENFEGKMGITKIVFSEPKDTVTLKLDRNEMQNQNITAIILGGLSVAPVANNSVIIKESYYCSNNKCSLTINVSNLLDGPVLLGNRPILPHPNERELPKTPSCRFVSAEVMLNGKRDPVPKERCGDSVSCSFWSTQDGEKLKSGFFFDGSDIKIADLELSAASTAQLKMDTSCVKGP